MQCFDCLHFKNQTKFRIDNKMKAIINLLNISLLVLSLTSSAISKDREGKFFLLSFLKGFFYQEIFYQN